MKASSNHLLLEELRQYKFGVVGECAHPALIAVPPQRTPDPDSYVRWWEQFQQWGFRRFIVPDNEYVVLFGVEASMLHHEDTRIHTIVGEMSRTHGYTGDARHDLHFNIVPPRQNYGITVLFKNDEPAGLILMYGWRVPEEAMKRLGLR